MSLFLVFSKQYRTEEKIITGLINKIKKSVLCRRARRTGDESSEIYDFAVFSIEFIMKKSNKMVVRDVVGQEIYSMNGDFVSDDEMQNARFNWFSTLLNAARERNAEEQAKIEKEKKLKDAKNALECAAKVKLQEKQHLEYAINALKRIKEL